jgi:riboflavin biosynthesis pyrimidine reductase
VRQIYPVPGKDLQLAPSVTAGPLPAAVEELALLYGNEADQASADRPWLRANMVASADGAANLDGRTGGLSGPADRMVFTVLRSLADVVLVGAGTVRTERYRPVPPEEIWAQLRPPGAAPVPAIAIVSASLDLDPQSRLLSRASQHAPTIVLTCAAAPADRKAALAEGARIIEAGDQRVDLAMAIAALADSGYRQILTEGGPALLGQLVAADLLDELCLTTSPLLAGGQAGRILTAPGAPGGGVTRLHLALVLAHAGYLLSRYLRAP